MKKITVILLTRNILWAIVIFVLTTVPARDVPQISLIPHFDKIVHFGMFFVMALLLCNEFEYQTKWRQSVIYVTAVAVAFIYGGVLEILQEHYFKRSGDIYDLIADFLGAIVGCLAYPIAKNIKNKLTRKKSL
ncbi:MAG: VanZ family protein [Culturomica sp.]|jgi:VanZ family protein|nr:VanZ family protein [Culturomica sp.]